jgi:hypothetical protein
MRCYVEELSYNYRGENEDQRKDIVSLRAIAGFYEKKFGKLFNFSVKN